jgi:hypothetical protein
VGHVHASQSHLCDGKARVVHLSACADTMFSVPARLAFRKDGKGVSVCGFISFASDEGVSSNPVEQFVKFTPTGRHADIFATAALKGRILSAASTAGKEGA